MIASNQFEQVPPGTRVFILGNGPSLRETPLHLLKNEHSWGVNQIHLIYPATAWRPTHITFAEMTAGSREWWPKIWASVEVSGGYGIQMYARDDAWWCKDILPIPENRPQKQDDLYDFDNWPTAHRFNACTHHDWLSDLLPTTDYKAYSWHFPQICKYGGAVPLTIQLAVMHGYCAIYLLGCDLGFRPNTVNHFIDSYGDTHQIAEGTSGIDEARAWKLSNSRVAAHELAKQESPVPIYNAGRGGELEVYPRILLEDLL